MPRQTRLDRTSSGFMCAILIRDLRDWTHFGSVSDWQSAETRSTWQTNTEYRRAIRTLKSLCGEVHGGSFELAASVQT